MDKDTRNRIQRATQAARGLLEQDFEDQLAGVFDIRMEGAMAGKPGSHLDAAQRIVRTKLVAAVEHFRASGQTAAEAVASYRREAAFTTLNRFVALKMLEARGLVQECLARGEQSSGFKEFCGLAPGLVQLPDRGYRLYVESLFDELSAHLRVLFNRRDASSLLWPKRTTLELLQALLNAPELAGVWGEDETLGWIYQYYNDEGQTGLKEQCRYLARRQNAPRQFSPFPEPPGHAQRDLDLSATAEQFWTDSEWRIHDALRHYAEQAEGSDRLGCQLLVEEAVRGLAQPMIFSDLGYSVDACFPATDFESPDAPSVYPGRPLTLQQMREAIDWEAGQRE
jgi:hypothetical protein